MTMTILRIIIDLLIAVGVIFALAGTIGVMKMPDTFCRMQASTCVTTLGAVFLIAAAILYAAFVMHSGSTAVKILVIGALVIAVNPIGAHAIGKGAYRSGVRPERPMEMDDFRSDFND